MATVYMNLPVPTVSSTPGPTYATNINAALTAIDSHNHTPGRGVQIPTAAININADLGLNAYSISNANSVRLRSQAGTLAGLDVNSLYSVAGNLYFNNATGSPIQLTSGTAINAAGFGGWTGDYVASGAQGQYTTATNSFALINGNATLSTLYLGKLSVNQASGTALGAVVAVLNGATQVNGTLSATGALSAASGALTGALTVGATLAVTGTSTLAGVSATTGTFSGAVSTAGLTASSITSSTSVAAATSSTTGNATVGGTLQVTGAASASALSSTSGGITSATTVAAGGLVSGAALQSTSSNTISIASGTVTLPLQVMEGYGGNGADQTNRYPTIISSGGAGSYASFYSIFLRLPNACTITQLTCTTFATNLTGTNNVFLILDRFDPSIQGATLVQSATGVQHPGLGFANRVTTTLNLSETIGAGSLVTYVARISINTVSANNLDDICAASVTYSTNLLSVGTR